MVSLRDLCRTSTFADPARIVFFAFADPVAIRTCRARSVIKQHQLRRADFFERRNGRTVAESVRTAVAVPATFPAGPCAQFASFIGRALVFFEIGYPGRLAVISFEINISRGSTTAVLQASIALNGYRFEAFPLTGGTVCSFAIWFMVAALRVARA